MIFIFTGNGKGKTTSGIGMGVRAVGAGKKVLMVQFLKPGDSSEVKIIKKIKGFDVQSFGRKGFFLPKKEIKKHPEFKRKGIKAFSDEDFRLVKDGFSFVEKLAKVKKYNLLILDEINVVLYFKLLEKEKVLKLLKKFKKKLDIVLTGRHCPKEIIEIADLVTEFRERKHYFKKDKRAKKGIEY
jgi:cob(I)alamin adenosyltransferase